LQTAGALADYEPAVRGLGRMLTGGRRRVRSDWMAVERERRISVSSAVISFEH